MIYTVTMNPAVDYLVYLDALRVGEIQRSAGEAFYFSGKGINVSKLLRTLGLESTALGFLAGFTGRAIADDLAACGIAQDFCFLPSGSTRINVKIRHHAETDLNCKGPEVPSASLLAFFGKLDGVRSGDLLVLSGSTARGLPKTVYADVLRAVAGRGVRTVVDADGELLWNALPESPFLVKPNREELSALLGRPLTTDADVLDGARELQRRGAQNVLVSLGGDGAILLTDAGAVYRMGVARGECVNSIGAGDSMLAGFLAGLLQTGDPGYALCLGTAAGAATAFSEGLATGEQIEEILRTLPPPERIG